ncbi:hypothetical protein Emag_000146 [Eimeria magna]
MKLQSLTASTVCLTVASVILGPPQGALALRPGFGSLSGVSTENEDAVEQASRQELSSPTDPSFLQFNCFGMRKRKKSGGKSAEGGNARSLGGLSVDDDGGEKPRRPSRASLLWRRLTGKSKRKTSNKFDGGSSVALPEAGTDNPAFDVVEAPRPAPRVAPPKPPRRKLQQIQTVSAIVDSMQPAQPQVDMLDEIDNARVAPSETVVPARKIAPPKPPRRKLLLMQSGGGGLDSVQVPRPQEDVVDAANDMGSIAPNDAASSDPSLGTSNGQFSSSFSSTFSPSTSPSASATLPSSSSPYVEEELQSQL